uniref:type II toxin-antitoxin system VapC family toxin n=1 Tax=Sphingomonas kyeonggiensis TaxID=1268553 RepID=UPI00278510D8|nr:type II toxin-antitoxin system VapC family toxin [Sphingomonas kyeonggiensis]MDQ0250592.1 tRNA(fMet)-specific endonuclease VapC [Sphingomonas kyeonggiensis]
MKFLLDSNIVIAASLGVSQALRARMAACDEGDLVTSAIAYAEILFGSERGKPPPVDKLRLFIEEVPVLDFDILAASVYASLPFKRGSFDNLIAAHALSRDLTIVTDNIAHFVDLPGLKVENWMQK